MKSNSQTYLCLYITAFVKPNQNLGTVLSNSKDWDGSRQMRKKLAPVVTQEENINDIDID